MLKKNPGRFMALLRLFCFLSAILLWPVTPLQAQTRSVAAWGDFYLSAARIGNSIWLFEVAAREPSPAQPFSFSPMLRSPAAQAPDGEPANWAGPGVTIRLDQQRADLTITSKGADGQAPLTLTVTPYAPDGQLAGINFFSPQVQHLLGLGADFRQGQTGFNLLGRTSFPGSPFGGGRLSGGVEAQPNQVQIPIVYALGPGRSSCALMVDETGPMFWDFNGRPWTAALSGPLGPEQAFRFLIILGDDGLPALRKQFMDLTGRPPIPPESTFGVWAAAVWESLASNWPERLNRLKSQIPGLAGLMVDEPARLSDLPLDSLAANDLNLMISETPYIARRSPRFEEMAKRGHLVRQGGPSGPPLAVNFRGAESGLIDYTSATAAAFWHSLGRADLVAAGIQHFRLAAGEPEAFSPTAYYAGPEGSPTHSHYAWANRFSLSWMDGLNSRLQNPRSRENLRLFMSGQSATAGAPGRGSGLFNGDSSLFALKTLAGVKAHLALSGVDYYGSDLTRTLGIRLMDQFSQMYDLFLAQAVLTDIPLVIPENILIRTENRRNLELRRNLTPYYYSLAYRAWRDGDPLLAPLAYYFQEDLEARTRGLELMLGPGLLIGGGLEPGAERVNVYVPAGLWYNFRTGEVINQETGGLKALDCKFGGQIGPPLLARAGAVIPCLEDQIRADLQTVKVPVLKIFMAEEPFSFTQYADDGRTQNYLRGELGLSEIRVEKENGGVAVTLKARQGSWPGADSEKQYLIDVYGLPAPAEATLDQLPYDRLPRLEDLEPAVSGWASGPGGRVQFKTPPLTLSEDHTFFFR